MPLGEFDLIDRYFARALARPDVLLGVGDDAALLSVPVGCDLVAATDTLVEGRHFLPGTPAEAVGHQALAVNLSDLAAMGADPAWALLSLSLPQADEAWLESFSRGLLTLAREHDVALVGGDTVAGPLVVTITLLGFARAGTALVRSGARPGDALYVSGSPGLAAAGLELLRDGKRTFDDTDPCVRRYLRAEPRVALGRALRGHATAAIDVSDGLLGDVAKLASASGVAAQIELERLPIATALAAIPGRAECERHVLAGGDDYELVFTLPSMLPGELAAMAATGGCELHRIGTIVAGSGVRCLRNGRSEQIDARGHDHFAS